MTSREFTALAEVCGLLLLIEIIIYFSNTIKQKSKAVPNLSTNL